MMILRHAPVVRVLIPYALGSIAGYAAAIEIRLLSLLLLSLLILFAMILIYFCSGRQRAKLHGSFCLAVFILFFVSGMALGRMDRPKDPGLPTGERVIVRGRVKEEPVIRDGRMVFGMELKVASSHDSLFKVPNYIRVYMNQGEGFEAPGAGETWVLCGRLIAFENGGNPGEVDYAFVMRRKNYWYRFYCDTSMVFNRRADEVQSRIPGPAEFRKILSDHWKGPPEKVSLLKALCLGDRSGLSEDLRQSYSQAGGMHILAVSGLHVGLIWWVLHGVLGFMGLFGKREMIRGTIIVLILWFYAYTIY